MNLRKERSHKFHIGLIAIFIILLVLSANRLLLEPRDKSEPPQSSAGPLANAIHHFKSEAVTQAERYQGTKEEGIQATPDQERAYAHLQRLLSHSASEGETDAYAFASAENGRVLRSQNPTHGFGIEWEASRVGVTPTRPGESWCWSLDMEGISVGEITLKPSANPIGNLESNTRVKIAHKGWSEWYDNSASGFEHGFVIEEPGVEESPTDILRVKMRMNTDLDAELSRNREAITMKANESEMVPLRYEKLIVTDATGEQLAAHLELDPQDDGKLSSLDIVVALNDPVWPVTIDPTLVSLEIAEFDTSSGAGYVGAPVVFQNQIFFIANDGVTTSGLWRSDGTEQGTQLVKDLRPGFLHSGAEGFTVVGDKLLFLAHDGEDQNHFGQDNTLALWVTDGTEAGTMRLGSATVRDEILGDDGSFLYFFRQDNGSLNLWKTDGTVAGTSQISSNLQDYELDLMEVNALGELPSGGAARVILALVNSDVHVRVFDSTGEMFIDKSEDELAGGADLTYLKNFLNTNPFPDESGLSPSVISNLIEKTRLVSGYAYPQARHWGGATHDGKVFFVAEDAGIETLWVSDGTTGGTAPLMVLASRTVPFVSAQSVLYFVADDGTNFGLWATDGTVANTVFLTAFSPGRSPTSMIAIGNTLYFTSRGPTQWNLWKSDGTVAGTMALHTANTTEPQELTALGNLLVFSQESGSSGEELWKSDGTVAGTSLLKNIRSGSYNGSNPNGFTVVGNQVYFSAFDGTGAHVWKTDGTGNGTVRVSTAVKNPQLFTSVGSTVFFRGDDFTNGFELWKTNGTSGGTQMVKEIGPGQTNPDIAYLTNLNGTLLFRADDDVHGWELWRSDGTEAGTYMVRDTLPATGPYSPEVASFGGNFFFAMPVSSSFFRLWKSDGSALGTAQLPFGYNGFGSNPKEFCIFSGSLYFQANGGLEGAELWKTDGTSAGTELVKDVLTGSGGSLPTELTVVGSEMFFAARGSSSEGRELWKTDGTAANTVLVKDIRSGSGNSDPKMLTAVVNLKQGSDSVGPRLFFQAHDGSTGVELWISDGTESGTNLVKNINSGSRFSNPDYLTEFQQKLIFSADGGSSFGGEELWISDGTSAGTQLLKNINPGLSPSQPENLTAVGNTLYFIANDGSSGRELWKTNGTTAGTLLIKDINPGATSGLPEFQNASSQGVREPYMIPFGSLLLFAADDGVHGRELWTTDGTVGNTNMLKDIFAGPSWSNPMGFASLDGKFYFQAATGDAGAELWETDGTEMGTVAFEDVAPGSMSAFPNQITSVGNTAFYFAHDETPSSFGLRVFVQEFTLTVNAGAGGSATGSGSFFTGDAAPITATPNAGFLFSHWTGSGVGDPNRANTTVGMTEDRTVTAVFAPIRDLALTVDPAGAGSVTGTGQYPEGAEAAISATANAGFHFNSWLGDGVADSLSNSTTVSMTANRSLTAQFDVIVALTVEGGPAAGGTVTGGGSYVEGTEASITAMANAGYRFDGWSGSGIADTNAASTTVTVDAAKTVTANFVKTWELTLLASPSGGGALTGGGTFDDGESANISVMPHAAYRFLGWSGDGVGDSAATSTTVTMSADRTVTANFSQGSERVGDGGITTYGSSNTLSSSIQLGNKVLYLGDDSIHGEELWVTDGTAAGTQMLLDINPDGSSHPRSFAKLGDRVFFRAGHPDYGYEMWESDGTTAGTKLFQDSVPGAGSSYPDLVSSWGDLLFYRVWDPALGNELGISDGSPEGTTVIDLNLGGSSSSPYSFVTVANGVFFRAYTSSTGWELWFSDGTPAGTQMLKDINPGGDGAGGWMTAFEDKLLFNAYTPESGDELWISDGTPSGTQLLKDIASGSGGSAPGVITDLGNGTALFQAYTTATGRELWRTDGTAGGTQMVKEILPGPSSSDFLGPAILNGNLIFRANDGTNGEELWISDGTVANTQLLKDLRPGGSSSSPRSMTTVGNQVFFRAYDDAHGWEPWVTDGTSGGTQRLADLYPGTSGSNLGYFTGLGNQVLFLTNTPDHGYELWKSDGTTEGTVLVKDAAALGPNQNRLAKLGHSLLFASQGGGNGLELYVSDGSSMGTGLLKAFLPDLASGDPYALTPFQNLVIFSAVDSTHGRELWKTDGTESGTVLIKDILPGTESGNPFLLEEHAGAVYFSGNDTSGSANYELWKTDGTDAGTVKVLEVNASGSASPNFLRSFAGSLFFDANDGTSRKIWKSDGSSAGTTAIANVSQYHNFVEAGGNLFFVGHENADPDGRELWMIDGLGNAVGLTSGSDNMDFTGFEEADAVNGQLIFGAKVSGGARQLWTSDGTTGGTQVLKEVEVGSEFLTVENPSLVDQLFFIGDDPTTGRELWVTDGTEAGTRLVKDIRPGTNGSAPMELAEHDGLLFFSAYTPTYGRELWVSDGTEAGTLIYEDVIGGFGSSNPTAFCSFGSGFYYFAHDDATGAYGLRTLQPDSDGVSETVEANAPNNGDGNGDGTPDSEQNHVTSLPIADSGGGDPPYVTLATPSGNQLGAVEAIDNPAPDEEEPPVPDSSNLPIGFLGFNVSPSLPSPGFSTTVEILLPPNTEANQYWKYGAEPGNTTPHWYAFDYDPATGTGAVFEAGKIILHLVDGLRGDGDLTANGVIVDPGAAIYVTEYDLTVSANPMVGGTVMGSGTYFVGDDAVITATPTAGYRFLAWSGSGVDDPTGATTTVAMTEDRVVVGQFVPNGSPGFVGWEDALTLAPPAPQSHWLPSDDEDGDQTNTFGEYVGGLSPGLSSEFLGFAPSVHSDGGAFFLQGEIRLRNDDSDLIFSLEWSDDYQTWETQSLSYNGSAWILAPGVSGQQFIIPNPGTTGPSGDNGIDTVQVRDSTAMAPGTWRYARLRVSDSYGNEILTDAMGFYGFACLSGSDTIVSQGFMKPPSLRGEIDTVSGSDKGTVTPVQLDPSEPMVANAYQNHYIRGIGGSVDGHYYRISSNSATEIVLATGVNEVTAFTTGARFEVVPYWSLAELFASGSNPAVHDSPNAFSLFRKTEVHLSNSISEGVNLSAGGIYFRTGGEWKVDFDRDPGTNEGDTAGGLMPDPAAYYVVRHQPADAATDGFFYGIVPPAGLRMSLATQDGFQQDNPVGVANAYPIAMTGLGFRAGTAFEDSPGTLSLLRKDSLLIYDNATSALNKAATKEYYFDSNDSVWRDANAGNAIIDASAVMFLPGSHVVWRKASGDGFSRFWERP